MKKYKILFCDLDGTLIKTKSGETFPKGIWDMEFRFEVLDTIKKMKPDYVLIVSNQGGVESGFVDEDNFCAKVGYVAGAIREYCDCECYGMSEYLLERYVGDDNIKQKSLMIGGGKEGQFSDSDKKTAENFGIDYMDVDDFVKCYNTWK